MSLSARWSRHAGVLALFIGLTVVHTWPLATAPATLSRNENADTVLNEWAVAWVQHQLPRAPLSLFHANILYPERNTLALSEHMVVQSVMGLPAAWLGASPVLVYNLLLMAGFALTGWAMYLVIDRWTGDAVAAVAAGSLAAFNTHVFARLPHLQTQHVEFLPLAIFALDRLLATPGWRPAVALGGLFALQGLTSNYWLAFVSIGVSAAFLVRPGDWTGTRARRVLPAIALAAAVALALVVPFLIPYYQVVRDQGLVRTLPEIAQHSATWRDYFSTVGRLHYPLWSHYVWAGGFRTPNFPGVLGLALALAAVATGLAWRDLRARLWLAVAAAGLALSFGPAVPGYSLLYHAFPLLKGVRAPVRMGHMVIVAVAALAGFGLAYLRRRAGGARWVATASVAAIVVIHVEALRAPLGFVAAIPPPSEYDVLAQEGRTIVAEFPFHPPREFFRNAQYMLNATRHWRPLVNGYSGFRPASYGIHYEAVKGFPGEAALEALRDIGVTHVVVHHTPASPASPGIGPVPPIQALQPIASSPDLTIYRLRWERIPVRP